MQPRRRHPQRPEAAGPQSAVRERDGSGDRQDANEDEGHGRHDQSEERRCVLLATMRHDLLHARDLILDERLSQERLPHLQHCPVMVNGC